jgi:hypothetical protein
MSAASLACPVLSDTVTQILNRKQLRSERFIDMSFSKKSIGVWRLSAELTKDTQVSTARASLISTSPVELSLSVCRSTDKTDTRKYIPNSMSAVRVCVCMCACVSIVEDTDRVLKSEACVKPTRAMAHRPLTEIEWAAAIHALRWRPAQSPDQCAVRRRSSSSSSWCCFSDDGFATSSELGCRRQHHHLALGSTLGD